MGGRPDAGACMTPAADEACRPARTRCRPVAFAHQCSHADPDLSPDRLASDSLPRCLAPRRSEPTVATLAPRRSPLAARYVMTKSQPGACGCGEFPVAQRLGCAQQPVEHSSELVGARLGSGCLEVLLRVVHRARQHVQVVVQLVELGARDRPTRRRSARARVLAGSHPVPLAALLGAELAWAGRDRPRSGSTLLHHRHRGVSVMTKWCHRLCASARIAAL